MITPEFLGYPLLRGNEFAALAESDLFFRWTPGVNAALMRVNHNAPGLTPEISPRAWFQGYPLAASPAGVLVGDDSGLRFMAVLNGFRSAAWHQDSAWTMGIPTVRGDSAFVGVGGPGAAAGIASLDPVTGATRWVYQPRQLRADRVVPRQVRMSMVRYTPSGELRETIDQQFTGVFGERSGPGIGTGGAGSGDSLRLNGGAARAATNRSVRSSTGGYSVSSGPVRRPGGEPQGGLRGAPGNSPPQVRTRSGGLGFYQRAANQLFGSGNVGVSWKTVPVTAVASALQPGHWANAGLVLARNHVIGEAGGAIVALDGASGRESWRVPLPDGAVVRSLVATLELLIGCVTFARGPAREPVWTASAGREQSSLFAMRLEDGQLEWVQPIGRGGTLALSGGLVYLSNGNLHALAPAERTFRLAVDSPRRTDYAPHLAPEGENAPRKAPEVPRLAPESPRKAPEAERLAPEGTPISRKAVANPAGEEPAPVQVADATLLRLSWGEPLREMQRKIRARREAAPGVPLTLALDWLTPDRSAVRGTKGSRSWSPEWAAQFEAACRELAATAGAACFDVAPEVNVYLAWHPDRVASVRELLRAARAAVRQAAPKTEVLFSFNVEVLLEHYGKGSYHPFGEFRQPQRRDLAALLSLAAEVDGVGLSSAPEAAFQRPGDIPRDYLLTARAMLAPRPARVVQLATRYDERKPAGRQQSLFLKRLLQACYWLDAAVVAYPDAVADRKESEVALRAAGEARPALDVWLHALTWKPVARLSLRPQ